MNDTITIEKESQVALVGATLDVENSVFSNDDVLEFYYCIGIPALNSTHYIRVRIADDDGWGTLIKKINEQMNIVGTDVAFMKYLNGSPPNGWDWSYDMGTKKVRIQCGQEGLDVNIGSKSEITIGNVYPLAYRYGLRQTNWDVADAPLENANGLRGCIDPHWVSYNGPLDAEADISVIAGTGSGNPEDIGWARTTRTNGDEEDYVVSYYQGGVEQRSITAPPSVGGEPQGVIFRPSYDTNTNVGTGSAWFGLQARSLLDHSELNSPYALNTGGGLPYDFGWCNDLNYLLTPYGATEWFNICRGMVMVNQEYNALGGRGVFKIYLMTGTVANPVYTQVGNPLGERFTSGATEPVFRMQYQGTPYQVAIYMAMDYDEATGDATWETIFEMNDPSGALGTDVGYFMPSWFTDIVPIAYLGIRMNGLVLGNDPFIDIRGNFLKRCSYGASFQYHNNDELLNGNCGIDYAQLNADVGLTVICQSAGGSFGCFNNIPENACNFPLIKEYAARDYKDEEPTMQNGNRTPTYTINFAKEWRMLRTTAPDMINTVTPIQGQNIAESNHFVGCSAKEIYLCLAPIPATPFSPASENALQRYLKSGPPYTGGDVFSSMFKVGEPVTDAAILLGFDPTSGGSPPAYILILNTPCNDGGDFGPAFHFYCMFAPNIAESAKGLDNLHIQLTNLPIQSYNGDAGRYKNEVGADIRLGGQRVKDIAIVPLSAEFQAFQNWLTLTKTLAYEPSNRTWIDLKNEMDFKTNDFEVYITTDDNKPATMLIGDSSISIIIRKKPESSVHT